MIPFCVFQRAIIVFIMLAIFGAGLAVKFIVKLPDDDDDTAMMLNATTVAMTTEPWTAKYSPSWFFDFFADRYNPH